MEAIQVPEALNVMGRLMAGGSAKDGVPQRIVAAIDWARFKAHYEARGSRPLLERVGEQQAVAPVRAAPNETMLMERLKQAQPANRRVMLVQYLQGEVAQVLRFGSPAAVDTRHGFFDMGLDSLTAVELKQRLEREVGVNLPAATLFNYPTVETLVDHLIERVPGLEMAAVKEEAAANGRPAAGDASPADLLARIEQLSDEEVEQLLRDRLREQGN
jgi:acyl carrier protein